MYYRICGEEFSRIAHLAAHMRRAHTGKTPYQCVDNHSSMEYILTAHMRTGERPHKCNMCNEAFTWKGNLTDTREHIPVNENIICNPFPQLCTYENKWEHMYIPLPSTMYMREHMVRHNINVICVERHVGYWQLWPIYTYERTHYRETVWMGYVFLERLAWLHTCRARYWWWPSDLETPHFHLGHHNHKPWWPDGTPLKITNF